MMNQIDHIGIAVRSIKKALPFYQDMLQLTFLGFEEIPSQNVKVAFLKAGHTKIELLESTDDNGPIAKFLEKRGEGVHHIAFQVKDIHGKLIELKERRIELIDECPRNGANKTQIAFLHPKVSNHVLIELCEKIGRDEDGR